MIATQQTIGGKQLPRIISRMSGHVGEWVKGVSNDTYHADMKSLSRSGILAAKRSPAHFLSSWGVQNEKTPALIIGNATDLAVFDREAYRREVFIEPKFGRKDVDKEAKADWRASLPVGAIVLDADDKALVDALAESVLAHPIVKRLLSDGDSQLSGYWLDDETELLSRCRPDWRTGKNSLTKRRVLADLKTARDASKDAFARAIIEHGYDVQAAHYLDGATEIDHEHYDAFVFIVVEKTPPYPCVVYVADEAMLAHGRAVRRRAMLALRQAIETGNFPAYGVEAQTISLPQWALTSAEDIAL